MAQHGDVFAKAFEKASAFPGTNDGVAAGYKHVASVLGELAEDPAMRHITTELAGLSDDALARALRGMARLAAHGAKIDNFVKLLKEDSLFTAGARARFLQRMDDVASINGPSADWVRSVLSNDNMKNAQQARGYLLEIICAAENKATLNPQRLSCEFSRQAKKVDPIKANSFGVDCDVLCNAIAWNCKAKVSGLADKFRKANLSLTKVENWELIIREHNAILQKELGGDIKAGFAFLGAQTNPSMLETLRQALIRIHGDAAEQYLKIYDL